MSNKQHKCEVEFCYVENETHNLNNFEYSMFVKRFWEFCLIAILPVVAMLGLSGLLHFLYVWLPCNLIAFFSPVSESVWEHVKIVFYPFLIVWVLLFVWQNKTWSFRRVAVSAVAGALSSCFLVLTLYYFAHTAFEVGHSLVLDIVIEAVAFFVGHFLALHLQIRQKERYWTFLVAVVVGFLFAVLLGVLSFVHPKCPLFV